MLPVVVISLLYIAVTSYQQKLFWFYQCALVSNQGRLSGLAGFCRKVEKTVFFRGKNRTGKNSFCRQK